MADKVKDILFVGATGWLGNKVINAILDKKAFTVKALVRKDTLTGKKELVEALKSKGAVIVEGDAENVEDVKKAAQGSDTVVSVLGGATLYGGKEHLLLEAAKAAGVKRFIPSQYGFDASKWAKPNPLEAKNDLVDLIKQAGLDYTLIVTGGFYEFWYGEGNGFSAKNGTYVALNGGTVKVSATLTDDIAKFVPEILLDFANVKNKTVYIAGETLTQNEAASIFEQATGKKLTPISKDLAAVEKDIEAADPHSKFVPLLQSAALKQNEVVAFPHPDNARYPAVKVTPLKEFFKAVGKQ